MTFSVKLRILHSLPDNYQDPMHFSVTSFLTYNTMQDAIFISQLKLKKKMDMLRSIGNSLGNRGVSPEEEKESNVGRICRKGRF